VRADFPFEVVLTREHDHIVASLRGDLDAATREHYAASLGDVLHGAPASAPAAIVVDASALEFIDSAGIAAVVRTSNAASEQGTAFRVEHAPRNIRRVFEITGLAYLLAD
jgi:anti-sigma B factor antagonist